MSRKGGAVAASCAKAQRGGHIKGAFSAPLSRKAQYKDQSNYRLALHISGATQLQRWVTPITVRHRVRAENPG